MNLVINTDLIKQYINNNEVNAIIFDGTSLDSLVIDGVELWTASLFKYELLSDGTYSIVGCSSNISGDVVIPGTYNGAAVTAIGNDAFANRTTITSITIPESVTYIGSYAMYNSATTLNFEHLYWKTVDRADNGAVGYSTSDEYIGMEDYEWHKFYAPEIAMTHYEDSYVDVTVKNYNSGPLEATVYFNTDESWHMTNTATVSAGGSATVTIDYSSVTDNGFDAFYVFACFDVFPAAKSNEIDEEYSYWPEETQTT